MAPAAWAPVPQETGQALCVYNLVSIPCEHELTANVH